MEMCSLEDRSILVVQNLCVVSLLLGPKRRSYYFADGKWGQTVESYSIRLRRCTDITTKGPASLGDNSGGVYLQCAYHIYSEQNVCIPLAV